LGMRAMFVGTMASYLSASLAGILFTDPSTTAQQSMFVPVAIMLVASAVILSFHFAAKYPDKAPAIFMKLNKA
ncbi:MAG: hypothetical protein V7746_23385, partial [Halioglobus sp.]